MSGIWRAGLPAIALAGVTVLATACSSDPAASATASATPTVSATASAGGSLAFSECMRSHGEPNFPDPNANGGYSPTGIDVNSTTYRNALNDCSSLRRGAGSGNSVTPQYLAKEVKFSQCMRAHGIAGFPDPDSHGQFSGESSMNPQSATFQNAQATCARETGLGSGGSSS